LFKNDKDEMSTKTVNSWRVCMNYKKLKKYTRKYPFPLHFIDQMLDRLAGKEFYYFLDRYYGYNQIVIAPKDQQNTSFTCPYDTFTFRRMQLGLCNAPTTFQRCMMSLVYDFIEKSIQVFLDDSRVFGETFHKFIYNVEQNLERCEENHLILNWQKCHFMVQEGIVLGHRVSKKSLEVDKSNIDVIEKLPPPTNAKGVRSFLGYVGFYIRYIKKKSQIYKP